MNLTSFQWLLIVVTKFIFFVDAKWITGNLCWSMPCLNGGSCFGSAYTYLCVCPMNYSGALCEKRLGICQESPCGNRGLCVETGLTSFECRCYFDYTGPLCEEHVPKDDPLIWSSLIPVHTRVLLDMLQEAYRSKANEKSTTAPKTGRPKIRTTITTTRVSPSQTTLSTTVKLNDRTEQSVTIGTENIIKSEDIQLEKIFPEMSTTPLTQTSSQDSSLITSQTFQTTEQNTSNNEITMTSTIRTLSSETRQTSTLPIVSSGNVTAKSLEQEQTNSPNITEKQDLINSTENNNPSISPTTLSFWSDNSSDINISTYTYESIQNSTEKIINNTDSNEVILTTAETSPYETNNYSSIQTESNQLNSSEQSITTTIQPISIASFTEVLSTSQSEYDKFLYKLCQQLLSHILPNASSLSSPKAVEAALNEASNSSSNRSSPVSEILSWIKEQFDSSTTIKQSTTTITIVPTTTIATTTVPITTTVPTTTTTISTTTVTITEKTTTTTVSPSTTISSRLSLLLHGKTLNTITLERLDMDEVLHPLNINNDGE